MNKLLYALLGLLALIVLAVVVGPGFVDWNAQKDRIAREVAALTGRTLMIDGDVSLSVLPTPAFTADGVRLSNLEGGSEPDMARLKSLQIKVALLPLLQGRVEVESLILVDPVILLETLPDGRHSWSFEAAAAANDSPAVEGPADGGGSANVSLERLEIRNGTLIYRNGDSAYRLESLEAVVSAESLRGPFAAEGGFRFGETTPTFELALGRLRDDGASTISFEVDVAGVGAGFSGSLSPQAEGPLLRGSLKASGDRVSALADFFAMGRALPPAISARDFSLRSRIEATPEMLAFDSLSLSLGDVGLGGKVDVSLAETPHIDASLSTTRLDLDTLLATDGSGATAPESETSTAGSADQAVAALPDGLTASVRLSVDALIYRGQVVRQLSANLELAEGVATIARANALLPGSSDLTLAGRLAAEAEGLIFTGSMEGASDNLRSLAAWLGGDLSAIPPDRLRRSSFTTELSYRERQLTLTRLDLRVDVTRLTGGVAIALRERAGFGVGLFVDKINLDAYLPRGGADSTADSESQDGLTGGESVGTAILNAFDANLDLRVGNLIHQGRTYKDLHLDGTLQRGSLMLREARLGNLAGLSGSFSGTINDLAAAPNLDGQINLAVGEPDRLGDSFGFSGTTLAQVGPVNLAGSLVGDPNEFSFDGQLDVLAGVILLNGTAVPPRGSIDLKVDLRHPSLAGLGQKLGLVLNDDPGPLALTGRVIGDLASVRMEEIEGTVGPVPVSGSLGAQFTGARPLVTANLVTGELPIALLLAPGAGAAQSDEGGGGGQGGRVDSRWSRDRFDLSGLRTVDASLRLQAQALVGHGMRLEEADLEATLTDGVLKLSKLGGRLYEGTLILSGTVDARDELAADLAFSALEMNAERLFTEVLDSDRVSGPFTVDAKLQTSGRSESDLVSRLEGDGNVSGRLTARARPEEQVGSLLLGVFGEKVKAIRGLTDAIGVLFNAFGEAPTELSGSFQVDRGRFTTSDAKLVGRDATAFVEGVADLPAWQMDTVTRVFRVTDSDTPYLTVDLRGPLDEPNIRLAGQPFQRQDEVQRPQTPDNLEPLEQSGQTPTPEAPDFKNLKPAEVLKKLLEGLN